MQISLCITYEKMTIKMLYFFFAVKYDVFFIVCYFFSENTWNKEKK